MARNSSEITIMIFSRITGVALMLAAPLVVAAASPLVEKVREATSQFKDINVALAQGWVQGTPCVSGPNSGAMGVHFVKPDRIYEPASDGEFRLVGVEFIVLDSIWQTQHPGGGPPALDGNLLNLVGAPNRYGLPAFWEIHVWAWENNPNGSFADWNTRVTCSQQPAS
jgi:hypothetical protein